MRRKAKKCGKCFENTQKRVFMWEHYRKISEKHSDIFTGNMVSKQFPYFSTMFLQCVTQCLPSLWLQICLPFFPFFISLLYPVSVFVHVCQFLKSVALSCSITLFTCRAHRTFLKRPLNEIRHLLCQISEFQRVSQFSVNLTAFQVLAQIKHVVRH